MSRARHGEAENPIVKVLRLHEGARLPCRMSDGASGWDLFACLAFPLRIEPGGRAVVPTGIALEIPVGLEGQVRPRSGLAARHGIGIPNAPGTIDSDYRGEVRVILANGGDASFEVRHGDRIAQLVIARVEPVSLRWADALDRTERGDGGFGHTGVGNPDEGPA
ncbi:MAG: dUTP diphosphatase [Candidatus Eisenbacteria bacterium]|nr:dUTP diphosphatase [Candidatus Latescibacterota bacterium]MBD3303453.1 dUTP diphosphatase [Candidatus Eisenbacteria bacterium]